MNNLMERFKAIYNFLKTSDYLIHDINTSIPRHYNCHQINIFSNLNVKEIELKQMEKLGMIKHFWFKEYGNCYYAV